MAADPTPAAKKKRKESASLVSSGDGHQCTTIYHIIASNRVDGVYGGWVDRMDQMYSRNNGKVEDNVDTPVQYYDTWTKSPPALVQVS